MTVDDDGSTAVLDLHEPQIEDAPRRRLEAGWVVGGALVLVAVVTWVGILAMGSHHAPAAPHPSASASAAPQRTRPAAAPTEPATASAEGPVIAQAALQRAGHPYGGLTVGTGKPVLGVAPPLLNFDTCAAGDGKQLEYLPVEIRRALDGLAARVTVRPGPTTPPGIGRLGFFFESHDGDAIPCRDGAAWPTTDTFESSTGAPLITGYVVLDSAVTAATPQGRADILRSLQLEVSNLRQFDDYVAHPSASAHPPSVSCAQETGTPSAPPSAERDPQPGPQLAGGRAAGRPAPRAPAACRERPGRRRAGARPRRRRRRPAPSTRRDCRPGRRRRGPATAKPASASSAAQLRLGRELVALGQRRGQRPVGHEDQQAEPAAADAARGAARPARRPCPTSCTGRPGTRRRRRSRRRTAGACDSATTDGQPEQPPAGAHGGRHRLGADRPHARARRPASPAGPPDARRRRRATGRRARGPAGRRASAAPPSLPLPRQPAGMAYSGPSARHRLLRPAGDGAELRLHRLALELGHAASLSSSATSALTARRRPSPCADASPDRLTPTTPGIASSARASATAAAMPAARGSAAASTRSTAASSRCRPGKRCSTRAERSSV